MSTAAAAAKPKVVMLKWYEFAKNYQVEHKLATYTDALKQAAGSWKTYKESFSKENPTYDKEVVLKWEREERERKIASGEIRSITPKTRKPASSSTNVKKPAASAAKPAASKVAAKEESESKREVEEDDGDYDVIIKETITKKKRKRRSASDSLESSLLAASPTAPVVNLSSQSQQQQPPLKKKRTRRTAEEMRVAREVAAKAKVLDMPATTATVNKRKRSTPKKSLHIPPKVVAKLTDTTDQLPETTGMEDGEVVLDDDSDFLEEMDEHFGDGGDELSSAQPMSISTVRQYADELFV